MTLSDRAFILIIALLLNVLLGGPSAVYQKLRLGTPRLVVIKLLHLLERKLNRTKRTLEERRMRGIVLLIALIFSMAIVGLVVDLLFTSFTASHLLQAPLIAMLIGLRPSWERAIAVSTALNQGNINIARERMLGTIWRNSPMTDTPGMARAAIEYTVVQFSTKLLTPVLAFLLAGLPGLLVTRTITLLAEHFWAHRAHFGLAAYRAEQVIQWLPSRISAVLYALTSWCLPNTAPVQAWRTLPGLMWVDNHYAIPMLSLATALNVTVGGPHSPYIHGPWIGTGTAQVPSSAIYSAVLATALSTLLLLLVLVLLL